MIINLSLLMFSPEIYVTYISDLIYNTAYKACQKLSKQRRPTRSVRSGPSLFNKAYLCQKNVLIRID